MIRPTYWRLGDLASAFARETGLPEPHLMAWLVAAARSGEFDAFTPKWDLDEARHGLYWQRQPSEPPRPAAGQTLEYLLSAVEPGQSRKAVWAEIRRSMWLTTDAAIAFARGNNIPLPRFLVDGVAPGGGDEAALADALPPEESPYRRRRGRRRKYDWDAFAVQLAVMANTPDGLPEVQADTEQLMADWCRDTWGPDSIPSETMIRERVGQVYTALRTRGKP